MPTRFADLLLIKKNDYNIDLGWYGADNLKSDKTGFYLYLFRGLDWNNSELLVKFYSKDKFKIVKNINSLIQAVDTDYAKTNSFSDN